MTPPVQLCALLETINDISGKADDEDDVENPVCETDVKDGLVVVPSSLSCFES